MNISISTPTNMDKYPARTHARRLAKELYVDRGLIYLPAARTLNYEDSDQPRPLHQRRYFYYLSGCDERDTHITYDIATTELTLWLAPFTPSSVVWVGRGSTIPEALDAYDISSASYSTSLPSYLKSYTSTSPHSQIYVLHPTQLPPLPSHTNPPFNTTALLPAMNAVRTIKSPFELALITEANRVSALAHTAVLRSIASLTAEPQVAALFIGTCIAHNCPSQAYAPIVGSGTNGSVLHYSANSAPFPAAGGSMVLDAGAEASCYAADVTRSFPLSGHWSAEGKAVYDLVERMQNEALEMVKPGGSLFEAHMLCHALAVRGLLKLGVLKGEEEELFRKGVSRAFYPHGLGHHLGLEVHDVSGEGRAEVEMSRAEREVLERVERVVGMEVGEDWRRALVRGEGLQEPCTLGMVGGLREGMVVTVEPGIYFNRYAIENLWLNDEALAPYFDKDVLERYYPVGGVRIEDDVLITSSGYRNLTTAPKGEEALRIIRGEES